MPAGSLENDVDEILIDERTLQAKVAELGALISADYAEREVTLVSVLKGALPFMADLMRAMSIPVRIDLMEVSSYGSGTESSGRVRILKDLSSSIEGVHVLIVEDIIDTGLTLNYLTTAGHPRPRRHLARSILEGMAYALLAGLPPQVGLYASIVPVLVRLYVWPAGTFHDMPTSSIAMVKPFDTSSTTCARSRSRARRPTRALRTTARPPAGRDPSRPG